MIRVSGVNALRVDGINLITFQTVVAELGTDLANWFPTEYHFASWLGLTPKRDVSGGKVIRHTREKSRNRVAGVLRMAANALLRSDSYLGARYRSLRARLGSPKAIKAMARYLACIIYRLFTKGQSRKTPEARPYLWPRALTTPQSASGACHESQALGRGGRQHQSTTSALALIE